MSTIDPNDAPVEPTQIIDQAEPDPAPPKPRREHPVLAGVSVSVAAVVVTLAMGFAAVYDPPVALATTDPTVHAQLAQAHDALGTQIGTSQTILAAAAAGTMLPDGTACSPALDTGDAAVAALAQQVATAQGDDQPATGLLAGTTRLGDAAVLSPASAPWTVTGVTALAAQLQTDAQGLAQAQQQVAQACRDSAAMDQATQAWQQAVAASQTPITDAQSLLSASAGTVVDDSTRTALDSAVQAVQAAQNLDLDGKTPAQVTQATTALNAATATLATASAAVQASQAAYTQAQQTTAPQQQAQATTTKTSTSSSKTTSSGTSSGSGTSSKTTSTSQSTTSSSTSSTSKTTTTGSTTTQAPAAQPPAQAAPAPAPAAPAKACYVYLGYKPYAPNPGGAYYYRINDPARQGWSITVTIPQSSLPSSDSGVGSLSSDGFGWPAATGSAPHVSGMSAC